MVVGFGRGHSHCGSHSYRNYDDNNIDDDDDYYYYNDGDSNDNNNGSGGGGGGNDEKPSQATGHIKLASKIFD